MFNRPTSTIIGSSLLVLAIILVYHVAPTSKKSKDGYYFEESTFFMPEFKTKIIMFNDAEELIKEFEKTGKNTPKGLAAFAVIRPNKMECDIYIIDPKKSYVPEFIGHELVHCLYGEWHQSQ
jgi:hypothetical protein